jgi:hypothetical protein
MGATPANMTATLGGQDFCGFAGFRAVPHASAPEHVAILLKIATLVAVLAGAKSEM